MASKAYDEERHRELLARDPDEVLAPDEHSDQAVFAPLRNINLAESLTVLTLLYVCTIAAFNAAYFTNVPGNFVEFFSLSDLVQTNIPMIQYFLGLAFCYFMIGLAISFLAGVTGFDLREKVQDITEPLVIKYHLDNRAFWIAFGFLLLAFHLVTGMFHEFGVTSFSVAMIPTVVFQGVLLYFFWVGYKFEMIPIKTLISASLLSLFTSSYNAGHAWIKSQIAAPGQVQTIQDKDGLCLERNILRSSSSGLLLYNPSLKQFEFRSKDGFKAIYDGHGCV
ncbi:hypothetical protein [Bradyrhizobium neotropicale]|uniref:hypothetical protein n=1 Tax=Bradyrhizobium neotropicale TaxID=1497615 RepID=UPI001AD78CF5|nr:hypothetical protein [Bradyrhizobium neotropicale]MBO4225351.1 hypothetical protein [Bradyrhizobium neotropicale]